MGLHAVESECERIVVDRVVLMTFQCFDASGWVVDASVIERLVRLAEAQNVVELYRLIL